MHALEPSGPKTSPTSACSGGAARLGWRMDGYEGCRGAGVCSAGQRRHTKQETQRERCAEVGRRSTSKKAGKRQCLLLVRITRAVDYNKTHLQQNTSTLITRTKLPGLLNTEFAVRRNAPCGTQNNEGGNGGIRKTAACLHICHRLTATASTRCYLTNYREDFSCSSLLIVSQISCDCVFCVEVLI